MSCLQSCLFTATYWLTSCALTCLEACASSCLARVCARVRAASRVMRRAIRAWGRSFLPGTPSWLAARADSAQVSLKLRNDSDSTRLDFCRVCSPDEVETWPVRSEPCSWRSLFRITLNKARSKNKGFIHIWFRYNFQTSQ